MTSDDNKKLRALTGEIRKLDISPFNAENLWYAGTPGKWRELRRILKPILRPEFAVTDVAAQAFLDGVRRLVDASACGLTGVGLVLSVAQSLADGDADVLETVLEVGANPDLPDAKGWRPSHVCGYLARVGIAAAVFPCRPDMAALAHGLTPLEAARGKFEIDLGTPERAVFRPDVARIITDGEYHKGKHPSVAELACRQTWFALKNLIRRQVVPTSEYEVKFNGKSAADWAKYYKRELLAKEINYFAKLPTAKFLEASHKLEILGKQMADERMTVASLRAECNEAVRKMEDLSEVKLLLDCQIETNVRLQNALEEKELEISSLKLASNIESPTEEAVKKDSDASRE